MESSIAHFIGLSYSEKVLKVMKDLKKNCQIVNKTFFYYGITQNFMKKIKSIT